MLEPKSSERQAGVAWPLLSGVEESRRLRGTILSPQITEPGKEWARV